MTFQQKIDEVLRIKQLSLSKLARETGFFSTLEKAYTENREMTDRKTAEFIQKTKISFRWWQTGEGGVFDENITPVHKAGTPEIISPERYLKDLQRLTDYQEKKIADLEKELAELRRKA